VHYGGLTPHSVMALEISCCTLQGGRGCLDDGAMVGLGWTFYFFYYFSQIF